MNYANGWLADGWRNVALDCDWHTGSGPAGRPD